MCVFHFSLSDSQDPGARRLEAGRKGLFFSTLPPFPGKIQQVVGPRHWRPLCIGLGGSEGPVCVWEKMDAFIIM